jgi:mannose-6-phosphate isomerase class I
MVLALTAFEALCGFLGGEEVWQNISPVPALHPYPSFQALFQANDDDLGRVLGSVRGYALGHPDHPPCALFLSLSTHHPLDPTALAPFYMHHVRLQPGEVLVIPGSQPHCYLSGQGIECMPPSDNVVRCGLTQKECRVGLFFDLCRPQPVVVRTHPPYHHEAFDPYFTFLFSKGPYPPQSTVLFLGGDRCGAWLVEEETTLPDDDPPAVCIVPN